MNDTKRSWPGVICGVVCWGLLVASTAFPALHVDGNGGVQGGSFYGWALLCFGWVPIDLAPRGIHRQGPPDAVQQRWIWPAWFANPCFVLGTAAMMLRHHRIAIAFGTASVALALTSLQLHHVFYSDLVPQGRIDVYGPGFFLWLLAMASSLVASIGLWAASRKQQAQRAEPDVPRFKSLQAQDLPEPHSPIGGA